MGSKAPIRERVWLDGSDCEMAHELARQRNRIGLVSKQLHRSGRKTALACHIDGAAGEIAFCRYSGGRLQRDYRHDGDRHYDTIILGQWGEPYTVEVRTRDRDFGAATCLFFRDDKPMRADLAVLAIAMPEQPEGRWVQLVGWINRGSFEKWSWPENWNDQGSVRVVHARGLQPISDLAAEQPSRLGGDPARNWLCSVGTV